MYIPSNALNGSRRSRLAIGVMLCIVMLMLGMGLTATTLQGAGGDVPAVVGFGAAAVSAYLLAWWSARFWYAAFSEGRRPEPVPQPDPWPWVPPPLIIGVAFVVSGLRELSRGDSSGWFGVGFGVLFGVSGLLGLVALVLMARVSRNGARDASALAVQTTEPPRPRRDWGPLG
ncbi:hypothetical protein [Streptomyces ureilyticus]|uniref:Uncharacterized protein n=1 Tax=Streptomyces ureilyticus TaxID=1775131 RepID=A0ABX0DV03_9ACTN|nr:hypothetical protein [Streptomyces ureilyticus]NGO45761.1 hypothetical protein [Streptomyces ureilyticus]